MTELTPTLKRLCIVTPAHWLASAGGAEYQIACLLDSLIPLRKYEIYYVARRTPANLKPDGYRIVTIGQNRSVPRLGYLMQAIPLYRALRDIRPDIIYQRVGCGYTGIAAHYARRNGARLIWHVSSDADVNPSSLRGGPNFIRRYLERGSIEYGIRHAHSIVAQTDMQKRLLERHYGRVADAVIRNFHPEPREAIDKTGAVSVVWVANLKPLKQPEVFVRLAARLRDLKGVRFIMVGAPPRLRRGNQEWYNALRESLRKTPNLDYLGQRTHSEINELLARAHIFVNTSLYEGFPNTFIQAWMREMPVVSLHVDPDGVLEREAVGVHAETEEHLVSAVRMFITNPARRAEYATRARKYAMLRHSPENARLLSALIDPGEIRSPAPDVPIRAAGEPRAPS